MRRAQEGPYQLFWQAVISPDEKVIQKAGLERKAFEELVELQFAFAYDALNGHADEGNEEEPGL
jgi:hypothetical protein